MRTLLTRIPPVVVLLVALALGMIAGRYWMAPVTAQLIALVATIAVFLAGLTLILLAGAHFRRHHTTIWPLGHPSQLVRTGPFRFSRNPVYLGMLLFALIPYAWTGQPAALLGPLLFFAFINGVTIPFEEARLRQSFPNAFSDYARTVRRWL